MKKRKSTDRYPVSYLTSYMALSASEKLKYLDQLNAFFRKAMPVESKKIWEKLKQQGF
jgi:hypothetical protein